MRIERSAPEYFLAGQKRKVVAVETDSNKQTAGRFAKRSFEYLQQKADQAEVNESGYQSKLDAKISLALLELRTRGNIVISPFANSNDDNAYKKFTPKSSEFHIVNTKA